MTVPDSMPNRDGGYPRSPHRLPLLDERVGHYRFRFARDESQLDALLRLRYRVFNLELGEGLESSVATGRDEDPFDAQCHHLMVEDTRTEDIVGTYRMQTTEMAQDGTGFYSAGEYRVDEFPVAVREQAVEVGRACVARDHRNRSVLFLLWKGLAAYMAHNEKRYLFGCCSLTSQDAAVGVRAARQLRHAGRNHADVWVGVQPGWECRSESVDDEEIELPILFRTYLRFGARVCSPPALDREFKTIDFLVLFDLEELGAASRRLFFG